MLFSVTAGAEETSARKYVAWWVLVTWYSDVAHLQDLAVVSCSHKEFLLLKIISRYQVSFRRQTDSHVLQHAQVPHLLIHQSTKDM